MLNLLKTTRSLKEKSKGLRKDTVKNFNDYNLKNKIYKVKQEHNIKYKRGYCR